MTKEFNPTQEMKQEALSRLKALHLHPNVYREYQKDGTVYYSQQVKMGKVQYGILYWLRNNPDWCEIVKEVENNLHAHVYHAILTGTSFGDILTMLYVPEETEYWDQDREMLKEGDACAYCYNLSDPECSEAGYIQFREAGGGLIRTA